jgi:apolipoprotein N-acyltransferase
MILGADDAEPRANPSHPDEFDYYNAAHLLDREATRIAVYRKRQLVIFGEYVPFVRQLPFLRHLTPIEAGFSRGPGPVPFPIGSPQCRTSVLICFEDVFPHLARQYVNPDTDFLLNLTNDGWFGQSAAHWQQAANAAFRAVENGLPLVRCTNNGLTCWIDAFGRFRQWLGETTGDVYAPGFLSVRIPLLPDGARRPPTFYNRYGDLFGWTCIATTLLLLSLPTRNHQSTTNNQQS